MNAARQFHLIMLLLVIVIGLMSGSVANAQPHCLSAPARQDNYWQHR